MMSRPRIRRSEARKRPLNPPTAQVASPPQNTCSVGPEIESVMDRDYELQKDIILALGRYEYDKIRDNIERKDLREIAKILTSRKDALAERLGKTSNENHALLDAIAPFAEIGGMLKRGKKIKSLPIHPEENKHFRKAFEAWEQAGKGQ